jgi:hypothetical protein
MLMQNRSWRDAILASLLLIAGTSPAVFAEEEYVDGGLDVVEEDVVGGAEITLEATGEDGGVIDDQVEVGEQPVDVVEEAPIDLGECGDACMFYSMGTDPDPSMVERSDVDVGIEAQSGAVDAFDAGSSVADYVETSGEFALEGARDGTGITVVGASASSDVAATGGAGNAIRGGHLR